MTEFKQVIVIRKDLNMRKGKMVAQGAHAAIEAFVEAKQKDQLSIGLWRASGYKKICVGCNSKEELDSLYKEARKVKLPCSYIVDSGLTEFGGKPTSTAIAIGPAETERIDKITGKLGLL